MYERNKVGSTLGDHTPILSLKNLPFLPLRDPSSAICSTEASMAIPSKVGETNYFILTKKTIKFSKVRLVANLTCQGVMCDRQKDKNGCSCLHATGISAVVYEADVIFEIPKRVHPKGKTTVPSFSSLKTTKVFFSNFANFATRHSRGDLQQSNTDIRRWWNWLTEYINTHGGWTLVGWFMSGDHSDAANPNEKVQNYQTTLHLSYVQPTRKDVTKDAAFVKELVDMNFTTIQTAAQITLDYPIAGGEAADGEAAVGDAAAAGTVPDIAAAALATDKSACQSRRGRPKHDT